MKSGLRGSMETWLSLMFISSQFCWMRKQKQTKIHFSHVMCNTFSNTGTQDLQPFLWQACGICITISYLMYLSDVYEKRHQFSYLSSFDASSHSDPWSRRWEATHGPGCSSHQRIPDYLRRKCSQPWRQGKAVSFMTAAFWFLHNSNWTLFWI